MPLIPDSCSRPATGCGTFHKLLTMLTPLGHLTYCSNIHAGENWPDHFRQLQQHIPAVRQALSPLEPFGIGLRLSNRASLELRQEQHLEAFRNWLAENNCYVFTMNGFPYGGFHHTRVKDQVHAPDWLSADRVAYTIRLAQILAAILPDDVDGGISTSPLSYKYWHKSESWPQVLETATLHILQVVEQLARIREHSGQTIHLDIEPEPDGMLGDGTEFLDWYQQYLLPLGIPYMQEKFGYNADEAAAAIREHVQLCYDVCHYAVGYEDHAGMINHTRALGIKIGKIQISAALKGSFPDDREGRKSVLEAFRSLDEPVYLHQVVSRQADGSLQRYADMAEAIATGAAPGTEEWRAHYHVPIFLERYGLLQSTQDAIREVLKVQARDPLTFHLEVETYTWEVLPADMRLPLGESITRELQWVMREITG